MSEAPPRLDVLGPDRYGLRGGLCRQHVAALFDAGRGAVGSGARIEIDVAGVSRADSAGMALLVEWLRVARQAGGDIRYTGMSQAMLALLRVADLDDVLDVVPAPAAD
ncbi:phospholipid transport system transporter-binding protein [Plasticicumulans lactativorans]|uniref:Phospholipid transport system transporter-binding protein n=1 Tax=Plasticicumulans lactativorans TaxID=1133106 RepID=A0A4R2KZM1_9GAMM|nr:STAS domain-containing protein [Plasticicumulans lactativorans]TCO80151.1 phospholipid transport system transporter-binding protein [Plasticicumulans lactativorans]